MERGTGAQSRPPRINARAARGSPGLAHPHRLPAGEGERPRIPREKVGTIAAVFGEGGAIVQGRGETIQCPAGGAAETIDGGHAQGGNRTVHGPADDVRGGRIAATSGGNREAGRFRGDVPRRFGGEGEAAGADVEDEGGDDGISAAAILAFLGALARAGQGGIVPGVERTAVGDGAFGAHCEEGGAGRWDTEGGVGEGFFGEGEGAPSSGSGHFRRSLTRYAEENCNSNDIFIQFTMV